MRRTILAAVILAMGATRALAQAAPPPPPPQTQEKLGRDLFGEKEPQEGDEQAAAGQPAAPTKEEPDTAAEPPAPVAPSAKIHPDAPTEAYDARVASSFRAAESFQGPLDGGWTLSASGEGALFSVRFVDHAGKLEAAWRDLRRKGALDGSGVVDGVTRDGGRLTLRFSAMTGVQDVVTLAAGAGGVWSGELDEGGHKRSVTLAKTSP
jgi:hypothetical protein